MPGRDIPVEAITHPRGLLELKRWELGLGFLDDANTLALGSRERAVIEDVKNIFSEWSVKSTPFSFTIWEIIGAPLEYVIGNKRPSYEGEKRAYEYINQVYKETGIKDKIFSDVREFDRMMKKLEKEGEEEENGQEKLPSLLKKVYELVKEDPVGAVMYCNFLKSYALYTLIKAAEKGVENLDKKDFEYLGNLIKVYKILTQAVEAVNPYGYNDKIPYTIFKNSERYT